MGNLDRSKYDKNNQIVGTDGVPVDTINIDGVKALQTNIAGGSDISVSLSIANKVETAAVTSTTGWSVVINATVPTGKAWYLKSVVWGTTASSIWRIQFDGVTQMQSTLDAADCLAIDLHGLHVVAGTVIHLDMDPGAVNKTLYANLVIYEA